MPETRLMDRITSVSLLLDYVGNRCTTGLYLFKGQRYDKPLLPKIGRNRFLSRNFLNEEKRLLHEFQIRSNPYLDLARRDDWDWLAIAQHNGMATRLLDWTDNPLAALWFAVKDEPEDGKHGVLWVFNVPDQDIVADQNKANPFKSKRTKVFRPKHIIKTIAAQGGWFTVHKYMEDEGRFIPFENIAAYTAHREKLIIPADNFSGLKTQLNRIGINDSSLFPDLRGLSDYLNWKYLPELRVRRFPRTSKPKSE
jgi:hypothetical protein